MSEQRLSFLERALERHLGECSEQSKAVAATLVRIEHRMDGFDRLFLRAAVLVITGQAGFIGLVFAAWMAWKHA